jgi:histidinol dehydrogenase
MRILPLTKASAEDLLRDRRRRDFTAERVAARILADVRRRGDDALFGWTRRLDRIALAPTTLWVERREFAEARGQVSRGFLRAIEHAARNIRRVAERQKPRPWSFEVEPGVRVGQWVEPLEVIGCYIPGGRFSLLSTLLMTAIPAQVAGVRRIIVTCPRPARRCSPRRACSASPS